MEIKNIETANKLFEQLKNEDAAILAIKRLAKKVVNTEITSLLKLTVIDERKKAEAAGRVSFDEDGSLMNYRSTMQQLERNIFYGLGVPPQFLGKSEKNPEEEQLGHNLTVAETMAILQMLLQIKTTTREKIIQQLNSMGFRE